MGPLNVDVLSCNLFFKKKKTPPSGIRYIDFFSFQISIHLIFTSSNGTTTKLSYNPW